MGPGVKMENLLELNVSVILRLPINILEDAFSWKPRMLMKFKLIF